MCYNSTIMNLKKIFTKHLFVITIVFPLLLIFFYGVAVSFALSYEHEHYSKKELKNYENELQLKQRKFLEEKTKYIASFMDFIYKKNLDNKSKFTREMYKYIASINNNNSKGFIFFFKYNKDKKVGNIVRHPCASKFIELIKANNRRSNLIVNLTKATEKNRFIRYEGTDCISNEFIDKVATVHRVVQTEYYLIISENYDDSSITTKKKVLQKKLDEELDGNLKLLFLVSLISILFSFLFSKLINILIVDYEKEIKESNMAMFTQARLAQAGEMLSMISHQWRQPISKVASIASNLRFQMMMGKEITPIHLDKQLNEIEDYTEFLSETIDDFKEFYKPKKLKERTFILPLIAKAMTFLEGEMAKKSIVLKEDFDKDVKILIYENELVQVLINIIQNAIELSKKGAPISIWTKVKSDEYVIFIEDEAGGIKEENIDKIFDAHFSTKSEKNSTNLGLGLYVSKVIIEKHFNGKLEVKSKKNSSIFIIRLAL